MQTEPLTNYVYEKTTKKRTFELDIALEKDFQVYAIEVKSSKNYTTSSLDNLKVKFPQLKIKRFVLGAKNIKFEGGKTTLPLYLAGVL